MCEQADLATHSSCIRELHGEGENGVNVSNPGLRWMECPLIQITSAGVCFGGGKGLDLK